MKVLRKPDKQMWGNSSPRLERESHYAIFAYLKISQVFIYKMSITLLFIQYINRIISIHATKVVIFGIIKYRMYVFLFGILLFGFWGNGGDCRFGRGGGCGTGIAGERAVNGILTLKFRIL